MKSQNGSKLALLAAGGTIIVCYIGSAISQYFSPTPRVDGELVKMASEINKTLPMMVDRETRADTVVPALNKTIIFQYTLINLSASDVRKDVFSEQLRPRFALNYKTDPHNKLFRDNGITIQAVFFDKNHVYIADMSVGPKDL